MSINSIRFDLSDWLIHFFRDINLEGSNSIVYVDHMGWGNIAEDTKWSALFMLRCAIRSKRLWATWSFRNNTRTIYGPAPAVCFTEMPIAAFLETGEKRHRRGEAMSPFALIFPKKNVFEAGANPVIYGLSDRSYWPPVGKGGGPRIINPSIISELEQYRYVTYNPASSTPIDWCHEREWRWPYRGDYSNVENALEEFGLVNDAMEIPGFDFYLEGIRGIGVVVHNRIQANWITHDILMLVDKGAIDKDTFQFILPLDELPSSEDLVKPEDTATAISNSLIDLQPFFSHKKNDLDDIAKEFTSMVERVERNAPEPKVGEFGGCWLWVLDNSDIFTRALISHSRVTVSESGKYLVPLNEFSDSRSLREREKMTQELAQRVYEKYGVECGYFSVLNSDNPNDVPFYNSDHLDNHMHYNVSWEH